MTTPPVRIDKWLWSVRIYKSRALAVDACKGGKVKAEGKAVKAAREVKVGDTYVISMGTHRITIKVNELISSRVNAKLAVQCYEDLTPAEEYERLRLNREVKQGIRPHGFGRPTKKERRDLENYNGF